MAHQEQSDVDSSCEHAEPHTSRSEAAFLHPPSTASNLSNADRLRPLVAEGSSPRSKIPVILSNLNRKLTESCKGHANDTLFAGLKHFFGLSRSATDRPKATLRVQVPDIIRSGK